LFGLFGAWWIAAAGSAHRPSWPTARAPNVPVQTASAPLVPGVARAAPLTRPDLSLSYSTMIMKG
jgi:hypothetical protein